ncbi:MAG TPA: nucleotidyltransferase substrate binding protein [Chitinispirillaceae bacterium]|nr:nucleotidyltransferase substrate binding protein [Chitinispirillaceae bacterium]
MTSREIDSYYKITTHSLEELNKAINHLDLDTTAKDRWVRLDAVAKRFEVSFEYVWKFLKAAGEYQGSEIPGPRPSILEAARYGWIDNREIWAGFLEARNAGVHDYFGLSSEEYAGIARNFYAAAVECVKRIKGELLS